MKKWISEGWKFRIKTSHGRKYITRRKKGEERSLGKYNENLWNLIKESTIEKTLEKERSIEALQNEIETLKISLTTMQNTIDEIKEELEEKSDTGFDLTHLTEKKISICLNHKEWYGNRFCSVYTWDRKPSKIMRIFPDVKFKRNKMDNEQRWRFIPHPDICTFCNPMITLLLQEYVDKMSFNRSLVSLKILKQSAERRVRNDHCGCKGMNKDGYCTLWHYSERTYDRYQKEGVYSGKRVYYDNVKKHPEICASCPSYTPKGVDTG